MVVAVWIAGAFYNVGRVPSRRQSSGGRIAWYAAVIGAWLILRATRSDWHPITTQSGRVEAIGLVVLLISTVFTLWARLVLGVMWSASPDVLKEHHQLRTEGPYAVTQHPIYTGLLGMLLGTALLNGLGGWIAALLLAFAIAATRVHAEERLMTRTFPGEYERYRERVPQLIPGLQLLKRPGRGKKG